VTLDHHQDNDVENPKRSYRFPPPIIAWVDEEARRTWRSRTSILIEAVENLRRSRGDMTAQLPGELPGQLPLPTPKKVVPAAPRKRSPGKKGKATK